MFTIFLLEIIFGTILIVLNSKNKAIYWLGSTIYLSGLGAFTVVLRETIIPFIHSNITSNQNIIDLIRAFNENLASATHYFPPYTFLMFTVYDSILFKGRLEKWKAKIAIMVLIPIIAMYILYPNKPVFKPSYTVLSIWVILYWIISNFLLVHAFIKEKEVFVKWNRLLKCLLITPITFFSLLTNYVLLAFNLNDLWRYNGFFIIPNVVLFFIVSNKYGILGVRLKLEKVYMDDTIKALGLGTALINHTIKNEISKINMCVNNINTLVNSADPRLNKYLSIISNSSSHMLEMVNKIHHHINDVVLDRKKHRIADIIENSILMVEPYIEEKSIAVKKEYNYEGEVICDEVHMKEVIINILRNSIEAMDVEGILSIQTRKMKNQVVISLQDNGQGISKENLNHVMKPFFTTKCVNMSYGLGLSYCYSVMQKHGGGIDIQSKESVGTTVYLYLPKV
ncbi:MAG: sensor histidine kinase [Bacillota bacterium]